MRFLKRLLTTIYSFLALFTVAIYISWLITGYEPDALIYGVFAGVGIESIVTGIIKITESKNKNETKKDAEDDETFFDA